MNYSALGSIGYNGNLNIKDKRYLFPRAWKEASSFHGHLSSNPGQLRFWEKWVCSYEAACSGSGGWTCARGLEARVECCR